MRKALFVALLMLASSGAHAADASLYDRIEARLAADRTLMGRLGKPGPEMQSVAWMIGTWDVVANVQGGERPAGPDHGTSVVSAALDGTWLETRDTYPGGTQDLGFLTYSTATDTWTGIGLDSNGDAVTTSGAGWKDGVLVLEGDVLIIGLTTHLRQTITRQGNDAYVVANEERAADGTWRPLDRYRYTRK